MIKIGMIIGERYEILEKIGTGGMSDVYKAKCHKLNRFVAVKVLKQEFSENANFVSKFRVEAQAAAGLMHPNIVNVYDVGEENGIYYIVMELVEGITLKKYIEKKARLSYKEAVSIAIQVSMGIEAAHNNHIIHRDIKPQNIIISKEGKVKVTDFGIAKAATSNTITSNVMGSVHYTSPEQARGGYSDEKSDIYSLGITLFEMLTGRVPFNGETTVAIAIKHIQEEMPSPRDFVPEIPASVDQIVLKCCQKSPDRRYQSIAELIEDLKQSLLNPDENFVVLIDPDEEAATRNITDTEMAQIKKQSDKRDYEESLRLRTEVEDYELQEDEEDYEEDYDPKMEKITTILAVVVGVIICCIIVILLGKLFGNWGSRNPVNDNEQNISQGDEPQVSQVEMLPVNGMEVEEARKALVAIGLKVDLEYEESEEYDAGTVISSSLAAGTKVDTGTVVTLTVSSGVDGIEVPDVTGLTYETALSTLVNSGFVVNRGEAYSSTVEKGNVVSQNPEGNTKAPKGSSITVNVSIGKESTQVAVPNVVGLAEDEAVAKLIEAGLAVGRITERYDASVAADLVCSQSYSHGIYVQEGTVVDLEVSLGPEASTYKYNGVIAAPSLEEAPGYVSGSSVTLTIVTDSGKILLDTATSSFPYPVNFTGIDCSAGTITFGYTQVTQSTTTTDPETGETIVVPGTSEDKSFSRRVEFTKE